jgi:capsular exopolysaccharide synthesis family protein
MLGVSSAIAGEGKTTVAVRLARALAQDHLLDEPKQPQTNILLLDGAPVASTICEAFGVAPIPGLSHYLQRQCDLSEVVKRTAFRNLWVLPSGGKNANFPVLIRAPRMRDAVDPLRQRFDLVIADLPALLLNTDAQVLADLMDHLLLVVRAGVTPKKLVRRAVDEVDPHKLAGIVLNDARPDLPAWLDQVL